MSGEAGAYLEGQPVIRVFGGAAASSFRRRLDEYVGFLVAWQRPLAGKKTLMDLVTRPSTFLWLIARHRHPAGRRGPDGSGESVAVLVVGHHIRRATARYRATGSAASAPGCWPPGACRSRSTSPNSPCGTKPKRRRRLVGDGGVRPGQFRLSPRRSGDPGRVADAAARHGYRARRPVRIREVDAGRPAGPVPRCRAGRDTRWRTRYSVAYRRRALCASRFRPAGNAARARHRRRKHRAGRPRCHHRHRSRPRPARRKSTTA